MCKRKTSLCYAGLLLLLLILQLQQTCAAANDSKQRCAPSSCGEISNISYPFRLKDHDPENCGNPNYELACENNRTVLTLFPGKYFVKSIDYRNFTIRLVDSGIQDGNCSSIPHHSLSVFNFTSYYNSNYVGDPYEVVGKFETLQEAEQVIYLNCSNPVMEDPLYVDTSPCINRHPTGRGHLYAIAGDLSAGRLKRDCHVKLIAMTSSPALLEITEADENISYAQIHKSLIFGFNLSWMNGPCQDRNCSDHKCYFNGTTLGCSLFNYCVSPLGFVVKCDHLSKQRLIVEGVDSKIKLFTVGGKTLKVTIWDTDIMDVSSAEPPKKKTRRPTSLQKFTNRLPTGEKYRVAVDSKGKIIGPYANKFKNYLGVVARTKISILPFSWDQVDGETKRIAWDDVKQTFDVPENEEFHKFWMSHIGGCWKQFKTRLNNEYVFGNGDADGQTTPCHKYSAISTETWAAYVKSRTTSEFVAKRESAKNTQKKNMYKHTMGPGGYTKLKENLKEEIIKKGKEESGDPDLEIEPTSPERHELWKAGRKKKSGSFVSEESAAVACKIDELTVMSSQGSFVPQGKNDILTAAIGTPEHPGRCRAAGKGVGLKKYFRSVHRSSGFNKEEFMNQVLDKMDGMVEERLKKILAERPQTCGGLCQNAAVQVPTPMTTIGSKGSCSPSNVKEEKEEEGKEEGEEEKIDWLKKILLIAYDDDDRHAKIELEHEKYTCFIGGKAINDMVSGKGWLELAHLSIWCTYLYRQVVEKGDDRYGILCPHKMNLKAGHITKQDVSEYIQRTLTTTNKEIYLAPFCHSNHWQLVALLPKQNTVVWMCSYSRQPGKTIKDMFSKGVKGDSTSAAKWLYPIMPIQTNGYHCGYYVMKFMLTILTAGIVDNWEKVFDNTQAYTEEEIKEIRQLWAEFFVKIRTEQKDTLFPTN